MVGAPRRPIASLESTRSISRWQLQSQSSTIVNVVVREANTVQEAPEKTHDLSEYSVEQVQALVDHMYTFDYSIGADTTAKDAMLFHTEVCLIADVSLNKTTDISSWPELAYSSCGHTKAQLCRNCHGLNPMMFTDSLNLQKYDMQSLKQLAANKFAHIATTSDQVRDWRTTVSLRLMA